MATKGMNKAMLIGNLGCEPEIKYTDKGTAICNFTLATNEVWKTRDGQKNERVEWHRIAMFGKLAEVAGKYLHKGSKVYIEGKIQTRSWTDDKNARKYSTDIVVHEMIFLGGGGKQDDGDGFVADDNSNNIPPAPDDEDVPF